MIRFLPVILLTLGLILTFSSLARAEMSGVAPHGPGDLVCLEASAENEVASVPEGTALKCWKKRDQGIALVPCQPDPSLSAMIVNPMGEGAGPFACTGRTTQTATVEPLLERPPPRA